ncbi:MAG: FAD:protein FMN transferase [Planctomycetota bacterium]|nr:FAD:protein FMN transferase [Planctomycetota bacterium]
MTVSRPIRVGLIVALSAALAAGVYVLASGTATYRAQTPDVLQARALLTARGMRLDARNIQAALTQGQGVLVDIGDRISQPGTASDVTKLDRAGKGQLVRLSWPCMDILRLGRELTHRTGGAYDMTGGRWKNIAIHNTGVEFTAGPFPIDLTGTARAYAVDKALHAMALQGVRGAKVELGEAMRCFSAAGEGPWHAAVPNPFVKDASLGTIALDRGAVCSAAGNGRAATVVAASATLAHAWAQALVVLGPEGLGRIDAGVEALVVVADKDNGTWSATPGFEKLLTAPLPATRRRALPPAGKPATTSGPATEPRP